MKVEDQTLPKQTSFWWECGWGCFWCLVGENSCDSSDISLITWATRCSWDVSPYSGASKNRHSGEKSNKCTYSAASKNRKAGNQTFSSPKDRPPAQSHQIRGRRRKILHHKATTSCLGEKCNFVKYEIGLLWEPLELLYHNTFLRAFCEQEFVLK